VLVVGYVHAENGIGELARSMIAVLANADIPYRVLARRGRPASGADVPFAREDLEWSDRGSAEDVQLAVVFENANTFPALVDSGALSATKGCYRIGYWAWEVDRFPPDDAVAGSSVDEIWTLSEHSARAIAAAVDAPVFVVPPAVRPQSSVPQTRSRSNLFRVLTCFDALSICDRKNPVGAVAAYRTAFDPDSGTELVVKMVNGKHAPEISEQLRDAIGGRLDVVVDDSYLSEPEYAALVASCDVYLSLHRSEGFGYTLAEAMAVGKPVVATGYSGNLEFMTPWNSRLVGYDLVTVGPGHEPYPATARWAEPHLDEAAAALRWVRDHPSEAAEMGARAKDDIAVHHCPGARVELVRRRVASAARRGAARRATFAACAAVLDDQSLARTQRSGWHKRLARRVIARYLASYEARQRARLQLLVDAVLTSHAAAIREVARFEADLLLTGDPDRRGLSEIT